MPRGRWTVGTVAGASPCSVSGPRARCPCAAAQLRSRAGSPVLLDLDLDVDARREVELRQRVHRLGAAVEDVDDALVRLQLELLARLLVDVRRAEDRPALRLRGERDRPGDLRP